MILLFDKELAVPYRQSAGCCIHQTKFCGTPSPNRGKDEKRSQDADREHGALGRKDLLCGAAAAGIATVGIFHPTPGRANIWEEGEQQCHASTTEKNPDYDLTTRCLRIL